MFSGRAALFCLERTTSLENRRLSSRTPEGAWNRCVETRDGTADPRMSTSMFSFLDFYSSYVRRHGKSKELREGDKSNFLLGATIGHS
ncbi:hypothetical protein AVEN_86077-1 [Araneus ventricosus]|uniref:Uncharacterized protein n=1 Tax=Araneus ventricosus TaxID=182803 RepID=A0A4Y2IQ16_ARAVE|nr:hypothetical protein AVEN_86077-1 [Araneus ventricosus]